MTVQSARHGLHCLHLRIDGHRLIVGENYTIIEMGYAVLLAKDEQNKYWLAEIGETIPPDLDGGRRALRGSTDWAVTSDPVVVALAYQDWLARNSETFRAGRSLRIPTVEQAEQIVRTRRIVNDFNRKYEGKLPHEWRASGAQ